MMNAKELLRQTESLLLQNDHITLAEASATQLHNALSTAAMNALTPTWVKCEAKRQAHRQAYYLSAEYLVGRMVYNNLFCLGLLDDVKALLAEKGVDIAILEDIEDDAFGNGGLGRLAACFLDSAVTTNVPLTGYGLRYRYGLFKQTFVNGYQHEEPDDWSRFGDPWSIRRVDQAVVVKMKTGDVLAVPYDMPIIGYGAKNIGRPNPCTKSTSLPSTISITRRHPPTRTRRRTLPSSFTPTTTAAKASRCASSSSMCWSVRPCRICCAPTRSVTAMITRGSPRNTPCS